MCRPLVYGAGVAEKHKSAVNATTTLYACFSIFYRKKTKSVQTGEGIIKRFFPAPEPYGGGLLIGIPRFREKGQNAAACLIMPLFLELNPTDWMEGEKGAK